MGNTKASANLLKWQHWSHYLRHHFPGAVYYAVYEAGYCGFWIHDQLVQEAIHCIVVNPADVPTRNKERRRKRDRVDCRKLARGLRNNELEGIYVPPQGEVGGSESDSDSAEHGSETNPVQKPDQVHAALLRGGDSRGKGDGPLVPTIHPMDRRDSNGAGQRGYGA